MKCMCDLPRWKDKNDKLGARSAFRGVSFHRQKGVFVVTDARTESHTVQTGKLQQLGGGRYESQTLHRSANYGHSFWQS